MGLWLIEVCSSAAEQSKREKNQWLIYNMATKVCFVRLPPMFREYCIKTVDNNKQFHIMYEKCSLVHEASNAVEDTEVQFYKTTH